MAKANAVSGTTYYLPEGTPVPEELADADLRLVGPGAPGPEKVVPEADTEKEGEGPSAGTSSSASTTKPPPSARPSSPSHLKPAQATERRSPKDRAASSTARSGATTSGPETGSKEA